MGKRKNSNDPNNGNLYGHTTKLSLTKTIQTNGKETHIGKVRKGQKRKKKFGLLEIGIIEILVKYTEIYNPPSFINLQVWL